MEDPKSTTGRINAPRDGKGKWRRGIESVERDAEACRLHVAGLTYQQISDQLGYGDKAAAHRAISRVLLETMQQPADELRAREVSRAEEIYVLAREIALKQHLAHSHGKVVYDGANKVIDDMPRMSAMDRMLKAMERIAKYKGLDAPIKLEGLTLEAVQADIARLEAEEKAAREAAQQKTAEEAE